MLLGAVSKKGHGLPTLFFLQGIRFNATAYTEMLDIVAKTWIELSGPKEAVHIQVGLLFSHKPT